MIIIGPSTQKVSDSLDDIVADEEELIGCGATIMKIKNPIKEEG